MSVLETRVSDDKPQKAVRLLSHDYLTQASEAILTVKALQQDMLETALILRDALYDIHRLDALTGGLEYRLEKALTTLDFPHFIPIENTTKALHQEWLHLFDVSGEYEIFSNEWEKISGQEYDLFQELCRRGAHPGDRHHKETKEFPALPDDFDAEQILWDTAREIQQDQADEGGAE